MASLFNRRKAPKFKTLAHLNWLGGPTSEVSDPLLRLRLATSACAFGEPDYYPRKPGQTPTPYDDPRQWITDRAVNYLRDSLGAVDPPDWRYMTPAQVMERAIDDALDADLELTLHHAGTLRQERDVSVTPQVMLVRAANHPEGPGSGLIRHYAQWIVAQADEPAVGLAYQLARYGKPVPNALKKAWQDALEGFDNLELAQHRMEDHPVKTLDVVNLVHAQSAAINQLMRDQLKTTGLTWEAIVSQHGSNRAAWLDALQVMDHADLLRNLRNLLVNGVPPERFVERLVEGAKTDTGSIFRYYAAYRAIMGLRKADPLPVLNALDEAVLAAMPKQPRLDGRVIALADNSASARGKVSTSLGGLRAMTVGNASAVALAMMANAGFVGIFGDRLRTVKARRHHSYFEQVRRAHKIGRRIGGRTEHGVWLFWQDAIDKKQHWDSVYIFSDMQAGHGALYGNGTKYYREWVWAKVNGNAYLNVPGLIARYREEVNPAVMVYLVQIRGYAETIIPEFYERTYLLGGWGEGLTRFAAWMDALYKVPVAG